MLAVLNELKLTPSAPCLYLPTLGNSERRGDRGD
jgi:hypothetical protein